MSHFRSALRTASKASPILSHGERKTEWTALEQAFKDTVGSATDVQWACATWAVIVSLMGSAYSSSGLATGLDYIMDVSRILCSGSLADSPFSDHFKPLRTSFDLCSPVSHGITLSTPTLFSAPLLPSRTAGSSYSPSNPSLRRDTSMREKG